MNSAAHPLASIVLLDSYKRTFVNGCTFHYGQLRQQNLTETPDGPDASSLTTRAG